MSLRKKCNASGVRLLPAIHVLIYLLLCWCSVAPAHGALCSSAPHNSVKSADFRSNCRDPYHNPETGRFWTQDSFEGYGEDPRSLHKYTYVANNPVNAFDPTGQNFTLGEALQTAGMIGRTAVNLFRGARIFLNAYKKTVGAVALFSTVWGISSYTSDGLVGFRTFDDKVFGGRHGNSARDIDDLNRMVDEAGPNTVVEVSITGHANPEQIAVGGENAAVSGAELLGDKTGLDLIPVLKKAMRPNGVIRLNGCNSANVAKTISEYVPDVTVYGYKWYIFGGHGLNLNVTLCGFFMETGYRNGEEVK